jgi:hypothetical protein
MFAEIDDRREQVQQAHQETFKWIFEDGHESGFAEWLSSGNGIFWINGKPASGKSTLMKFVTQEKRLKELLDVWTGSSPLIVYRFISGLLALCFNAPSWDSIGRYCTRCSKKNTICVESHSRIGSADSETRSRLLVC